MSVQVRRRGQRSARKAKSSVVAATLVNSSSLTMVRARPILLPETDEIIAAMKSLYADELKPVGRILRKRIAERAAADTDGKGPFALPDVHGRHLRQVCDASPLITVEPEDGGEWGALLVGVPGSFMDVYSPNDVYPQELWDGAAAYFETLGGDDILLPGGRYSCAQALAKRELPFLKGYSVGKICHIVQLAISQKKILGYLNGGVVPYNHSQSMVKEQCVLFKQPCAFPIKNEVMPLATWDQALLGVRNIMDVEIDRGQTVVPLSNVKRLFRSRFNLELSETMLGHLKLSDLLQDPKFADICTVQLEGNGYNVIKPSCRRSISLEDWLPVVEESGLLTGNSSLELDTEPCRVSLHLDEAPCTDTAALYAEVDGVPLYPPTPSFPPTPAVRGFARWSEIGASPSNWEGTSSVRHTVHNTFIHTPLPPTTPMRTSRRRTQSVPRDMGASDEWGAPCLNKPVKDDGIASAETVEGSNSEWDSDQHSSTVSSEITGRSPPPDAEDSHDRVDKIALEQRRPQFRPSVSLTLEDEAMVSPEPAVKKWTDMSLTPAKLSRRGPVGRFIRNTFIHASEPPPTPSPASANRGQSIPRNFGSEKSLWETTYHSLTYLPNKVDLTTPKASSPAFLRREQGQWTPTPLMTPECRRRSTTPLMTPEFPEFPYFSSPQRSGHSKGPVLRLSDLL